MIQSRQPAQERTLAPAVAAPERARGAGRGNEFAQSQLHAGHDHEGGEHLDAERPIPGSTTGAGDTARRPGTDVDAATRQALLGRLQGVPEAAGHLAEIKKISGGLDFPLRWSGRGSYMTQGGIYLDIRAREMEAVVQLTHELAHLLNYLQGEWAAKSTSRR
jgi:hypothetical protein